MFGNFVCFYGEEFSAPRPITNLEDHPLLAVRDCLFNISATAYSIYPRLRSIPKAVPPAAVVTGAWFRIGTGGELL